MARVAVVEAEHGLGVAHGGKVAGGCAADALGGRVGPLECGVGRFKGLQLFEEAVEFSVGDDRLREDVVAVEVLREFGG